jgi:hypothetical protein
MILQITILKTLNIISQSEYFINFSGNHGIFSENSWHLLISFFIFNTQFQTFTLIKLVLIKESGAYEETA